MSIIEKDIYGDTNFEEIICTKYIKGNKYATLVAKID